MLDIPPLYLGMAGGALAGRIFSSGESAISQAWAWFKRGFTSTLQVDEQHGVAYHYILAWASHYLPASTHLLAQGNSDTVDLGPAPGLYRVQYQGKWVWVEREVFSSGANGDGRQFARFRLSLLGRHRPLLAAIMAEGKELFYPADDRIRVTVQTGTYWGFDTREPARTLGSVLLDAGLKADLLADIEQFLGADDWYARMGIPYQRGYLLYGPPGNGKTSLLKALAGHFRLPLYILNLADPELTDGNLAQLLRGVGRSIVLLEDVDAVLPHRQAEGERKLTFSGVLNALDGVVAARGRLLFMTTNHEDELDGALIRPGRIDCRLLIDNAGPEQVAGLFLRFFPGEVEWSEHLQDEMPERRLSMAAVQGALLQHRDCCKAAGIHLRSLYRNPPPIELKQRPVYAAGPALNEAIPTPTRT